MMEQVRPFPMAPEAASADVARMPFPTGESAEYSFTTMEALIAHFSQWLPVKYVYNLIEAEKEIFVVRREVSLQETRLQFLKKCESAMVRILLDLQAGRTTLDWSYSQPPQGG